jgi:hypothetical protein
VIIHNRGGSFAEACRDLADVLKDGDQRHAETARSRGELIEVR